MLPIPGDPFLLEEWLRHYAAIWKAEVDRLYITVSWPQSHEVREAIRCAVDTYDPHAFVHFVAGGPTYDGLIGYGVKVDHGYALDALLQHVEEDYVVLMEDDLYVRVPGEVDRGFTEVEQGEVDLVGPARGSASWEILQECKRQWGTEIAAFWPHLLFTRAGTLRGVGTMNAKHWYPGEYVPGLGLTVPPAPEGALHGGCWSADTFSAASYELRAQGRRCRDSGQVPPFAAGGRAFHVGSLSSGPLTGDAVITYDGTWPYRVAWWRRCERGWGGGGLEEYRAAYQEAVAQHAARCGEAPLEAAAMLHDASVTW